MSAPPLRRHHVPLIVAGLVGACGGGTSVPGGVAMPEARVPPPSRIEAVFVLESGGIPADDTVVTYPRGRGRAIIVRRGAPDNSFFAEIVIPADSGAVDTARVSIRPDPGRYGIEVTATGIMPSAQITFSYGVHFVAPSGARARYGSDLSFEQALHVARWEPDGRVVFLPTRRPGSDMVTATITGPGRYLVAAPGTGER